MKFYNFAKVYLKKALRIKAITINFHYHRRKLRSTIGSDAAE